MRVEALQFLALNAGAILSAGGFVIGFIFGAIVIVTNFCTMGAIADIMAAGDYRRFRSWVLAAAIAVMGTQALAAAGTLDIDQSIYLRGGLNWFGSIAGGLIFGFGMVLAGGCPSRNIARAGAGDMRALVALLVVALFAHITMGGLLGPARQFIDRSTFAAMPGGAPPSLAYFATWFTAPENMAAARIALPVVLTAVALIYCFASGPFRRAPRHILAGIAVGLCAIAAWVLTTLAQDEFVFVPASPTSLSFVRPLADSVDYITRFTGIMAMDFGVALVLGTFAGALAIALPTGRFRFQGFVDTADTARSLTGAAMMGVGGVLALGCSIGQGVAGLSTLAVGSFIAVAAIISGAVAGIRFIESRI